MKTPSLIAAATLALAACATAPLPTTNPAELKAPRPGLVPGYLPMPSAVNSLTLLAPPPAPGSAQQAADDAAYRSAIANRDSPRWKQAAADAVLRNPKVLDAYSCALGLPIDAAVSPHLAMLVRRSAADAGFATYRAKDHYQRPRPFMVHNGPMCTPEEDAALRKDGSYPSGHSALGWAVGLVLIEVAPDRADALAQRARAYGQSRVACGVHWQSDVDAGREVAAAVVAQLHGNADFVAQLAEARKEVAAARAAGAKPLVDCAAEAAALAH